MSRDSSTKWLLDEFIYTADIVSYFSKDEFENKFEEPLEETFGNFIGVDLSEGETESQDDDSFQANNDTLCLDNTAESEELSSGSDNDRYYLQEEIMVGQQTSTKSAEENHSGKNVSP